MADRDAELVAQAQSGSREAFAQLVRAHLPWVGAVAAGVLGDFGAARDVAVESFRRAFVSLSRLPHRRRFRPWLYTLTQRTALDWLRHRQETQDTAALRAVGQARPDSRQRALAEILALPPHHREAILLRYVGNCTAAAMAERTGGKEADADERLARAERALALRLRRARGGEAADVAWCSELAAEALRTHPFDHELAEETIRQLPEFAEDATQAAIPTRVARYQRRALVVALALVAVVAVAALVAVALSRRRDVARAERMEGPAGLERHLAAGSWVRMPEGSSAVLRLSDGSRLAVRGGSSVLLRERRQLRLAQGEAWLEVAAEDQELAVDAPVGVVTCREGELLVECSGERTRLVVRHGRATLAAYGREVEADAGQVALAAEGEPPTVADGADGEAYFAWVDELMERPAKLPAEPQRPGDAEPRPQSARELPEAKLLTGVAFAEGRSPHLLALHAMLRAAGATVSYPRVAGLSGEPFRFVYSTQPPYGANLRVENPLRVACGLLGWRLEHAAGQPWAESWLAVRGAIAIGQPVLVGARRRDPQLYATMDWLLVCGYDLGRGVAHVHALDWAGEAPRSQAISVGALRDAHLGYTGTPLEPNFPEPAPEGFPAAPRYRVTGKAEAEPPSRQVAVLTALARAVAYAKAVAKGRGLDEAGRSAGEAGMGQAAYGLWQRHVRSGAGATVSADERKAIAGFGDAAGIPRSGWPLAVLKLARRDAADFLADASGEFEGPTRRALQAAASAYRGIAEDMATLGAVYPSASASRAKFAEASRRSAVLIGVLGEKELEAARYLSRALELGAARGRRPLPVPAFQATDENP